LILRERRPSGQAGFAGRTLLAVDAGAVFFAFGGARVIPQGGIASQYGNGIPPHWLGRRADKNG